MTWRNKIIWSEGMFLRPHHFQQHDRYLENLLESRCAPLRAYGWGIRELSIDQDLLTQGKLSVSHCKGVLPDGTPFDIPGEDTPPPILEIPENTHDTLIHLALPARRQGAVEADRNDIPEVLARYLPREQEVDDSNDGADTKALVQTGSLRLRLMLDGEDRSQFICMPLARIVELRADMNLLLDEAFLPPALDCRAHRRLHGFLDELQGLLHHRGEALAGRITASGRGGAAEIADFMVLEQNAVAIPLQERKYGIRVATLADRSLIDSANFVLAVGSQMPTETLRNRFPAQIKIGPVEQIRELVNLQLSGVALRPLPVAPRQIPYHAGLTYFELDRSSELWKQLKSSGGFAFHIGGEFPGLELEFWAIKG
ncbi:type VI secretion system baseplate subunit TssK [bacterium endosymbiont of Escarpia laminata]|nr:MAG: type VI secretion system baseplate subunit TssK [bacterium endosymbiont of Escarpia laminata]